MKDLFQLHIPRTGGTALRSWMLEFAGNDWVIHHRGHQPFGWHKSVNDIETVQYFTLLREPIQRLISCYLYLCKNKQGSIYEEGLSYRRRLSFDRWIEKAEGFSAPNSMCFMITGKKSESNEAYECLMKNYFFVGLQESLQMDVEKRLLPYFPMATDRIVKAKNMNGGFSVNGMVPYFREDGTPGQYVYSAGVEDLIQHLYGEDIKLYQMVKRGIAIGDFDHAS